MSSAISTEPARSRPSASWPAAAILILVIDVQGARQVRSHGANAIGIFVLPPSFEALERRLRGRSKDPEEAIRAVVTAARESARCEYDYVSSTTSSKRAWIGCGRSWAERRGRG
jgi:guanylate kinase